MKWLPIRQTRNKLRKFIQRHPIAAGIATIKIDEWLGKGWAALRDFFSSSAGPSASAPILPGASAPLPPPRITTSTFRFRWPVEERAATVRFRQDTAFFDPCDATSGVCAAEKALVRIVRTRRSFTFSIVLSHSDSIQTIYTGFGSPLIRQGDRIEKGQKIAALCSLPLCFFMTHKNRSVDLRSFLPPFGGTVITVVPFISYREWLGGIRPPDRLGSLARPPFPTELDLMKFSLEALNSSLAHAQRPEPKGQRRR
jgi:hypothetical protein